MRERHRRSEREIQKKGKRAKKRERAKKASDSDRTRDRQTELGFCFSRPSGHLRTNRRAPVVSKKRVFVDL